MASQPPASLEKAYFERASPIPSTPGSIASSNRASRACECERDAGASPLFPPLHLTAEAAAQQLRHTVGRSPASCGQSGTRWTLSRVRAACPWLWLHTDSGMHHILKRLRISWQPARSYIHSPDLDYDAKLANVQAVRMLSKQAEGQVVVVYLDEVTIEQQPSLAHAYAVQDRGRSQPRARLGHSSNTLTRVVATLEHGTGQVVYRRANKITIARLVQFFQDLRAAYPQAERIYVVMDNWPVHIHPDVLVALERQETRHLPALPPSWSDQPSATAVKKWGHLQLPIQLIPLPTYASWCNSIEKLWRKLRQELTHLHQWAADLPRLRAEIDDFLDQFATGSHDLLRYVGLDI